MSPPPALHLLLAAPPGAPGLAQLLERAAAAAATGGFRILLTGEGLAWAEQALPVGADVAVCSRNARDAGWSAARTPQGVRWSSVATWLAEIEAAGEPLWVGLP